MLLMMLNTYHFLDHSSYLVSCFIQLSFPEAVEHFPLDSHPVANKKAIHAFHYYNDENIKCKYAYHNVKKYYECHNYNIEKF